MRTDSIVVDLIWEVEEEPARPLLIDPFMQRLFELLDQDHLELAILITNDEKMRELNGQYRQKDRTTDVLSFPNEDEPMPGEPRHLGDIAISYDQARRQAEEIGQPLDIEMRFLCLHGVLHLLGYDHETDNGEMLALQSDLKSRLDEFF